MSPHEFLQTLSEDERGHLWYHYVLCGAPFGMDEAGFALWIAFDMWTSNN